ncbi:MAG: 2-succinyl-5-enolpyruvyl-6-hydroxy-3-cyclohexene-1-carboxylic-acid synthase [Deltaproteobacteria bacterium]|nr:2-succinyl-5-enolpyruvyl-6-hydroxy-3-cyclohexene-1-carboxylic-acid synthase [Deltaproteobacteria bacterium]
MGNIHRAREIISALKELGVYEFVVCAGARNSPLAVVLSASSEKLWFHFEERSAAFFALGRARNVHQPVAIVTTSGTAAAELLPATIEAYYSGVPLVLVTADRPKRFRGTGAPQTIDQTHLFSSYVQAKVDVDVQEVFELPPWDGSAPMQVNVCFDEPLIDVDSIPLLCKEGQGEVDLPHPTLPLQRGGGTCPRAMNSFQMNIAVSSFLNQSQTPLVILGMLESEDRVPVCQFLQKLNAPIYAEAQSGLRESPELADLILRSGEMILERGSFDAVLRIGGVPTTRFWRDLETKYAPLPVVSISTLPFSGLARESQYFQLSTYDDLNDIHANVSPRRELRALDRERHQKLLHLFERYPSSEPALVYHLSRQIPKGSHVYVGNSLPIREWDLAATYESKAFDVTASRGANGIDGQLSTFLGLCRSDRENWGIFGDLTTLYDLAGPWVLQHMEAMNIRIVVINNGGGKIFDRMFEEKKLLNEHRLSFEPWARMWGLQYERWNTIPERISEHRHAIFELIPDSPQTRGFWDAYEVL